MKVDYDAWAAWYDAVHLFAPSGEVPFYVDLAKRVGGSVLEIGVGTGRIAVPIAQAGVPVLGIDLHPAMLAKARAKGKTAGLDRKRFDVIEGDMRTLDLPRTFPLVIMPGRTLCSAVQTRRDQHRALERAAAHVAPGGTLALNVYNPAPLLLAGSIEPFLVGERTDNVTGMHYRLWSRDRFDSRTQRGYGTQTAQVLDIHGHVIEQAALAVRTRYIYASELVEMVSASGFQVVGLFGDFDQSPVREGSLEIILIARRSAP